MRILAISIIVLSFLVSCTTAPKINSSNNKDSSSPMRVIDAHIHTRFDNKSERNSGITYSLEELKKEMQANNIVGAMSLQYDHREKYPDLKSQGIFYCAGLREKINYKLLEEQLKRKEVICIKIYLGYVHKYANDPAYHPAYKLAAKYEVPVIFHTGDVYDMDGTLKHAHPLTIDEVAIQFRKVNFVLAHMGNPWIRDAAELAYKNPNVYLDGSAFFAGPMATYPEEQIKTYMVDSIKWVFDYVEDPRKVMYATDWPLVPMKDYLEAFKRAVPQQHWNLVFHDNAKNLFKLPIE